MSDQNTHNALVDHQLKELGGSFREVKEEVSRLVPMEIRFDNLISKVSELTEAIKHQNARLSALEADKKPLDAAAKAVGVFIIALCGAALTVVWEKAVSPQARADAPPHTQTTQQPK